MRPSRVNLARAVVLAVGGGLVAACSSGSTGVVSGVVHVHGGPSGPPTGQPVNTGQPTGGQEVVVVDQHQNRTTVTSDASGRYSLSLPPGRYTLMCGSMPQFTVTVGQTVILDCDLAVA